MKVLRVCKYADNTVFITESGKQLQKLLETVVFERRRMGPSLNVKKTECMVISKKSSNPKCNLVSKGEQYWDQTASVRIEGEHSDFQFIKRGVRQGFVMSPDLLNLYNDIISKNLDDISLSGLKINGDNLNNLKYADDTVFITEAGKQLQKLLETVVFERRRMGPSLNVKKTECMVISKKSSNPKCNLVSKGEQYWDQTASVRIEGEHSDFQFIKRGVRQGCVMSPDLLNLYNDIISKNPDDISGLKINGDNLNNLKYADDTVFITEAGKQHQKLLETVALESKRMGQSLNVKKTECMVI
ncbi:endonuclease-reverse transcriptase [Plakobranchus ocellatus]|uniref:Endonuclease-reverse transcriptase n=1 Tax=Plakobranchus ocellatus TaxID=259542 RepID=A0AAV4BE26_9GAST|nr:endonuclease-reverse transcriptase [Plakobranchus ocellatus]